MSRTNLKKPKDGQDLERITRKRYTLDSGQNHSHGMSANFTGDSTSVLQPYLTLLYIIKT